MLNLSRTGHCLLCDFVFDCTLIYEITYVEDYTQKLLSSTFREEVKGVKHNNPYFVLPFCLACSKSFTFALWQYITRSENSCAIFGGWCWKHKKELLENVDDYIQFLRKALGLMYDITILLKKREIFFRTGL